MAQAGQTARTRQVAKFDWALVPSKVTRALLKAAYESGQTGFKNKNLPKLSGASAADLAATAEKAFGRPPKSKHMKLLASVLVKDWLPTRPCQDLLELAATVQKTTGREVDENPSKEQLLNFFDDRNLTPNFVTNLHKSFVRAHKSRETIDAGPRKKHTPRPGAGTVHGEGGQRLYDLYPHVVAAGEKLTNAFAGSGKRRAALLVLPTGAGKTDAAVEWLLDRMIEDRQLRVLWIAHQQELLQQAAQRFDAAARVRPEGFERRLRVIHARGSAASSLVEPTLDIAAVTIQTLVRDHGRAGGARWRKFLQRPTYVVVDEAHHAGAHTYDKVLDAIEKSPNHRGTIGLTATPFPASASAKWEFNDRFGKPAYEIGYEPLIEQNVLARPTVHTLVTGTTFSVSSADLKRMSAGADFQPGALAKLDEPIRNAFIARAWQGKKDRWGKTLVFAGSIDHAEALAAAFDGSADVRTLHSRVADDRGEILRWFRGAPDPVVLVSVGMLTEGVDLPSATTAFLCRPTTSRILLRQMVGRVLRGPRSGGQADAHIVDFRDRWTNFGDILEPFEVLPVAKPAKADGPDGELIVWPDLVDADGREVPGDVEAAARRQIEAATTVGDLSSPALDPTLYSTTLVGYYQLDGQRRIPVFEHQGDGYGLLVTAAKEGSLQGRPPLSYFEGTPPPYPTQRMLKELVEAVRDEAARQPIFVKLEAHADPDLIADQIRAAGRLSDDERAAKILDAYRGSLARTVFPSLEYFEQAVEQALRNRQRNIRRLKPERSIPLPTGKVRPLKPSERDLAEPFATACREGRRLLSGELKRRWARLPVTGAIWSARPSRYSFAYWTMSGYGPTVGRERIVVNRMLRSDQVPDEVLAYLLYHEMLHSLLPGQGHDAQFRELEALWPSADEHDLWLDTIHERFDTDPRRYRVG